MAITATAQSALPNLSWDETIVPSLRKRLENESRAISKRMSAASIGSGEDSVQPYHQNGIIRTSQSSNRTAGRATPSSTSTERPSAIPRPSLNYSRPSADSSDSASRTPFRADPQNAHKERSRTFSQSYVYDQDLLSDANGPNDYSNPSTTRTTNALPTPASSRSNSPAIPYARPTDVQSTLITKGPPNNKVASNPRADGRITPTSNHYMQVQSTTNGWPVYEGSFEASSHSSVSVPVAHQTKQNGIMHEAPPFTANSSMISDADMERPSAEEERPFEHWYRGDLSRNGGVGELRVGNRMEMLEIAHYGHKLRHLTNGSIIGRRRRAESIGNRESVLFDEYELDERGQMVLDETPLTDMEADTETDREMSFTKSHRRPLEQPEPVAVNASNSGSSQSTTYSDCKYLSTPTRIADTPRDAELDCCSDSSPPSRARQPAATTSASGIPHSHAPTSPAEKRGRTRSPQTATPTKKPRASTAAQQKQRSRSVLDVRLTPKGEYPDVVLPVVARKMGLADQYEEADGSPKSPHPPSQEIIPPQPGTFGIDLSKRRRHYDPATGEVIPMDDIGQQASTMDGQSFNGDIYEKSQSLAGKQRRTAKSHRHLAPSPAPFSQYARYDEESKPDDEGQPALEESHGGCCRCIIM
ncbi:hypothetical protein DFH11DRAFT_1841284 [Phellopilus nigrolimitatus]|nr:hypothetical protein DFH11DRAFT_1841284 [Phellopilus nigrolimitatus]